MLITLGYPRSGSTLFQFLLSHAKPTIKTVKLHGHDMINDKKNSIDDGELLMLIRNYKECIMSHLTRDDDQDDTLKIKVAFEQYVKVLEVYEASTCKKNWCYYEDLIKNPYTTIKIISDFFSYNMKYVLKDLNNYLKLSKINYIKKLGNLQTTGTETIYFSPKTKHYDFSWDEEIEKLNPTLYAKYLKVYNNE